MGRARDNTSFVFDDTLGMVESGLTQVPVSSVPFAWAHGLGSVPKRWQVMAVCVVDDGGYSVGDEVNLTLAAVSTTHLSIVADATNIYISWRTGIPFKDKDTTALTTLVNATTAWKLVFRAWPY